MCYNVANLRKQFRSVAPKEKPNEKNWPLGVLILMVLLLAGCPAPGGEGGGSSEPKTTVIVDAAGLQAISDDPAGSYTLGGDIDCSATSTWNSGAGFLPIVGFSGTFDGAGHQIQNLFINRTADEIGLFATITGSGDIRNVALVLANMTGHNHVGAISGTNNGNIRNCSSSGALTCTAQGVGGLVGVNYGTITSCSSSATVTGGIYSTGGLVGESWGAISRSSATGPVTTTGSDVGGLVGNNTSGAISDCYATGNVTGKGSVGGLVGQSQNGSYIVPAITNCYATGSVHGSDWHIGGLVGVDGGTGFNNEVINNSFSAGGVSGGSEVGGLVGMSGGATLVGCYWDITRSGQTAGSGYVHAGDALTGVNSGSSQTDYFYYTTNAPLTAWDFTTIWEINSGVSYPTLRPDVP
jgi:hypothetical protein